MLEALEDLKRTVHVTLKKATKLNSKFSKTERRFKKQINVRLKESLRDRLVQEIEKVTERINEKLIPKERDYRMFKYTYEDKEIWVAAYKEVFLGQSSLNFSVTEMKKEYSHKIAIRMETENPRIRLTQADEFRKRVETLKSSIMKGGIDDNLKIEGKEVLWEIMGYNGKLHSLLQD